MTINQFVPDLSLLLGSRIGEIRKRICNAAQRFGRDASEVHLMAVTKTVPADTVNIAIEQGVDLLGENRVQEFLSKYSVYRTTAENIHFIGHLQTNKVKKIVDKVSMIESVDSISLAKEINDEAGKRNRIMPILLEINIGEEKTKFGFFPSQMKSALEELSKLPNIQVSGLMTIPPKRDGKLYFRKMQRLYIDISNQNMDNINMSYLSMGMSEDFESAVECGANIIRIGTAIFGKR